MKSIMLFAISLFCAIFWGALSAWASTPLWFVIGAGIVGFLGGWFAYGLCAGGAVKKEPKI